MVVQTGPILPHHDATADNTATEMKAAAGKLYYLEVANINNVDVFLQLFNVAAVDVTVGTTAPVQSFIVPAGTGTVRAIMEKDFSRGPLHFRTAISYAVTTTVGGNTSPGTAVEFSAGYL